MHFNEVAPRSEGFWAQVSETMSSSNFFGGVLWVSWFGLNICVLKQDVDKWSSLQSNDTTAKTHQRWEIKKKLMLSALSTSSSGAMLFSWLDQAKIINLGPYGSLCAGVFYGAGGLVCGSHLWDTYKEIYWDFSTFFQAGSEQKKEIALKLIQNIVKVTFLFCATLWGGLGMCHSIFGGEMLFNGMNTFFYYSTTFFIAYLAALFFINPLLSQKKV